MANTLRRKMFKLGGEVNTHGVGITSGLEYRRPGYNAGGKVAPIGQVGKGPLQMKGPDGKMREMQNPLGTILKYIGQGLLPVGTVASTKGIGAALSGGLKKAKDYFGPRRTFTKNPGYKKELTSKVGSKYTKSVPEFRTLDPITVAQRVGQGMRIGGAGVGAGTVAGIGSALLPNVPSSEDDVAAIKALDALRSGLEGVADLGTSIPTTLAQAPFRKYEDIQYLTDLMKGEPTSSEKKAEEAKKREEKLGSEFVPTSDVMEIAQTQEEQFAKMQEDAAAREKFYYDALSDGGPDKLRALGDAFTNFGALYDEDKVSAIAGFNQGITGELDRDAAIKDEARRLGLSDIIGDEAEIKQDAKAIESAKNSIMTNPDLSTRQKIDAVSVFDSYLSGITETVPTNAAGNELNTDAMKANSVYLDPEKISGSSFVAVDRLLDIRPFNNKEEAKAHAES